MEQSSASRRRLVGLMLGVGLVASACGATSNVPDSPAAQAASDAASANIDDLAQSESGADIELLNVADGSVSTLRNAIAGDRPVLLWFWAPH